VRVLQQQQEAIMVTRLVDKSGDLKVRHLQLLWRNPLYAENAVLLTWRLLIQVTLMNFFAVWLAFGFIYWLAENLNGATCEDHVSEKTCSGWPDNIDKNNSNYDSAEDEFEAKKCVTGVYDFPSALLFSVETMTTIGYGSRYINTNCPIIVFFTFVQSISGVIVTGVLTGLVMAKFEMPVKARRSAIKFSERASVLQRENGELYLAVKVVDQEVNRLDRVSTEALLVVPVTTEEGEHIPLHTVPIDFGISGESTEVPFLWPVTLLHHISEDSPFWKWGAEQWLSSDWEILLWINGASSSGYVSSRTSYKAGEVDWSSEFSTTSADVAIEKDHLRVSTKADTLTSKPQQLDLPFEDIFSQMAPSNPSI